LAFVYCIFCPDHYQFITEIAAHGLQFWSPVWLLTSPFFASISVASLAGRIWNLCVALIL
jgi:hypothetical protein